MKTKSDVLTVVDFFEKLQQDKLETTQPFSIIGMVKKSQGNEKIIEFAPGANCSNWVTIPLEFIEDVEMMKTISCRDHSHPLIKLNMKTPETTEGKIFFALLKSIKQASESREHNYEMPPSLQMNSKMSSGFGYPQDFEGTSIYRKRLPHRTSAWGCWDSTCAENCRWETYTDMWGEGHLMYVCDYVPCTRCIWPY